MRLKRRFPGYRIPDGMNAVFLRQGGFLYAERCITTHISQAKAHGAEVHAKEQIVAWEPWNDGVRVVTNHREYYADHLVCYAGAWISKVIEVLKDIPVPERQVLAWFQPKRPQYFNPKNFPVFNVETSEGRYYGFPVIDSSGFKIGRYHHREEIVDPDTMNRECDSKDEQILRGFVERYFPDAAGPTLKMQTCIFTNTPDEHFILDFHPQIPNVVMASPCSGHGFKFASVVGEILADLVIQGDTAHDISLHRFQRLSKTAV